MVSHKEDGLKEFQNPPPKICHVEISKECFWKKYSSHKEEKCIYLYKVCPDRIQGGAPKTNRNLIKGDSIKS